MSRLFSLLAMPLVLSLILTGFLTYALYLLVKKNRYRLLCGIVANFTILSYFITLTLILMFLNQPMLLRGYFILVVIIAIPIILLTAISAYLFIFNGLVVWRRESHSLGNVLTLIIGFLLIIVPVGFHLLNHWWPHSKTITFLQNVSTFFVHYLLFWVLTFLMSFVITKLFRPKYDQEYVIVLGSGLIDGTKVSPLLGSRIQLAIDFQKVELKKTGKEVTLVMSGGQGGDEKLPEGIAMKEYAVEHGASADQILVDDKSKNTFENMLFSKVLLEERGFNLKKGIFTTSDYHVFRAAGYARLVGLNINGIGSKTSSYFLPNALIREYIAILLNHKLFHFLMALLIVCLSALIFV